MKLYEREKFQEQLLNTISTEVLTENLERQNLTIVGQDEEDLNVMKAEIIFQKKLIIEMIEKNELLVELLEKTKEDLAAERKNTKNKSYTEALKNTNKVKELRHVPNIIIQPKTHLEKNKALKTVKSVLQNDVILPLKNIRENNNCQIIIKNTNEYETGKLQVQLSNKIGHTFEVRLQDIDMPRLKVDGIDNNMSLQVIEYDINQRNFIEEDNGNL